MIDFHYVHQFAQLAGYRVLVMANRFGCNNDFSRAAHDKLLSKLDELIDVTRRVIAAENKLALDPDGPDADEHGEEIWCAGHYFTDYWTDPEGEFLLHCDISVDWFTKEWYDASTGRWHFMDGFPLPRVEVGDDRLNGLCDILRRIEADTGFRFNTYTTDPAFFVEEEDADPEYGEDPAIVMEADMQATYDD